MTLFNADKVLMLPLSILIMAGFNLSCSNNALNNFPSIVMSKKLCGSTILHKLKVQHN